MKFLCLLALLASPLYPAISYVQSAKVSVNHGTSAVVAFPSNNTAGCLIVVSGGFYNYSSFAMTVSDSQGNAYTAVDSIVNATSESKMWYAKNCIGGANTVTVSNSGTLDLDVTIAEYSGADPASPLHASATSTANPLTSGSLTIGANDGLLAFEGFSGTTNASTFTASPSSGTVLRQQTSNPDGTTVAYFDLVGPPVGSYTQTVSVTIGTQTSGVFALFQTGAAGVKHRVTQQQ
jgi:hypothetical protein